MLWLLLLCTLMFAASYGLGSLPLHLQLPDRTVARMSTASVGLLIASALAIIIPEGCKAVYGESSHGEGNGAAEAHSESGRFAGLAILLGFILMFLIDRFTTHLHASSSKISYVAVDNLHALQEHHVEDHAASHGSGVTATSSSVERTALASTFGLVVHSLADGIALGSSAHADASLNAIVFLAILLHKGPAAFGLVSILLHGKLSRRSVKLHLVAFSLAAPLGAITIYLFMLWLGLSDGAAHGTGGIGLLLLFSGGTFLFVAISHAPKEQLDAGGILCLLGGMSVPVLGSLLVSHDH